MKYLTDEEIKASRESIREKFERGRPLSLKGRVVSIFENFVRDRRVKVLDCGTGRGHFVVEMVRRGYRNFFACDIDDYLAPDAAGACAGFKIVNMNFEPLPWPDGFFDAVTAWETLEHLENPHQAIREIHRVLQPSGIFIASLPNIFQIVSRLVFLKRGVFPRWNATNNHISLFPRGIFEKSFLPYFELIYEGYVSSKINLPVLRRIPFLPENQWFGNWVYYVFRNKKTI